MRYRFPLAILVLVALAPVPGNAHEETALGALSVLDDVSPDPPGVSFRVVHLTQPVLVATNKTDETLVILGEQGEPFLRILGGRVEMNVNSPLTYVSASPMGDDAIVPQNVDPEARPVWQPRDEANTWSWFDPRIRFRPGRTSWRVEARLGDKAIVITGSFENLADHGHFKTNLDAPKVDGLTVRLLEATIPAIYVENNTGELLEVKGRSGEPFLEIGPDGVRGNVNSPDYWLGATQTIRPVPDYADPDKPAKWETLSRIPLWSWLEFRARLPNDYQQRSELGGEPRTILNWVTPVTLGGESIDFTGSVRWIPPGTRTGAGPSGAGPEPSLAMLPFVIGGIVLLGVAFVLLGRRKTAV